LHGAKEKIKEERYSKKTYALRISKVKKKKVYYNENYFVQKKNSFRHGEIMFKEYGVLKS
jgi:hypothetical protein